jgi:hypothetical protein
MFSRALESLPALILFMLVFAAPACGAPASDEIGEALKAMEAEFGKIEEDMKDANAAHEAGVSGFATALFDSSFGLASYLRVMDMLYRNRAVGEVARIAQEVRMIYSETGYKGVNSAVVFAALGAKDGTMDNPYGGHYTVGPAAGGSLFCVQASGIKSEDCDYIAKSAWPGAYGLEPSAAAGKAIVARGDYKEFKAPTASATCSKNKNALHTVYFCYR